MVSTDIQFHFLLHVEMFARCVQFTVPHMTASDHRHFKAYLRLTAFLVFG